MHERKSESEVAQSCLTLCDPMDCGLPGSSIHGIFQARVLEWGVIAFSNEGNRKAYNSLKSLETPDGVSTESEVWASCQLHQSSKWPPSDKDTLFSYLWLINLEWRHVSLDGREGFQKIVSFQWIYFRFWFCLSVVYFCLNLKHFDLFLSW